MGKVVLDQKKEKKVTVERMFDSIAWRYDFLNHFLSLGIDNYWRRRLVRIISKHFQHPEILDVATGTCDLAISATKLDPSEITGIDISENMLNIGREKIEKKKIFGKIKLMIADSENLPFADYSYDVAMVAFGVRNFSDPLKGLSEMYRVLKKGGMIFVLEFSKPSRFPFRSIYYLYFKRILPVLGKMFSKNDEAYTYLPESVMKFPDNENFIRLLQQAGFSDMKQVRLTGGIASIYTGVRI
jgi:demethylmenaquinone methyltransferase / 2-methoxy-6-polyprenyl-1,4-benzoquinol methylase